MDREKLDEVLAAHNEWIQSVDSDGLRGTRADLRRADLRDADLSGADLRGADLSGSISLENLTTPLTPEEYRELARDYRERNPNVPVVENLDAQILRAIDAGATLNMCDWHTCDTTHCRAGFAVVCAGAEGRALEKRFGPEVAGIKIYKASTGRVPDFFASDEDALADIREQAALQMREKT